MPTLLKEPRKRSRRDLDLAGEHSTTGEPTSQMKKMAVDIFTTNEKKNELGRKEKGLREKLTGLVAKSVGLVLFRVAMKDGRKLKVTYKGGETSAIDMQTLINEVGAEKVLGIASVTQADVKSEFGSAVLAKVKVFGTSDPKLEVKEEK